jgi:hypothetical protein
VRANGQAHSARMQLIVTLESSSTKQRSRALSWSERTVCAQFLIACYASLEHATVRKAALKLVSLPVWHAVNGARRKAECARVPKLGKHWAQLEKQFAAAGGARVDARYVPELLSHCVAAARIVGELERSGGASADSMSVDDGGGGGGGKVTRGALIRFVAHCGELVRDIESQVRERECGCVLSW